MPEYSELGETQLKALLTELMENYKLVKAKGLRLDMSRGKPGKDQLDLSNGLLSQCGAAAADTGGIDYRNYGVLDGIPEVKRLMASLLDMPEENVFAGGNSSLSLIYDTLSFALLHGLPESKKPWCKEDNIRFLCPVPGYDRHINMTGHLGFGLIPVPMTPCGPDMDAVEREIKDPAVKGIWCVPKYSNPQGITYSDDVVRRFASLSPAATDFRIMWDNAYSVHALDMDSQDELLNIYTELKKNGRENMVFVFTSTSKITFSGAGIAAAGMSAENLKWFCGHQFYRMIGNDKINQLRHALFLPDYDSVIKHMRGHAAIIAPKFRAVLDALAPLADEGIASWHEPRGGYFISLNVMPGCAKRVVQLCKEAGVILTPAGATHPNGIDPDDSDIRIAPTFPGIDELKQAADLLCLCVRIASAEKLLAG